jgi:hypothetical protein
MLDCAACRVPNSSSVPGVVRVFFHSAAEPVIALVSLEPGWDAHRDARPQAQADDG